MDRRRVLIRIFKFFLTLALIWVLLAATWIFLPSRQHDDALDSDVLNRSKVLSRVYSIPKFYPWGDETPLVRDARRSYDSFMSLDIKLEKGTGNHDYTLVLGARHDSFAYTFVGADRLLPYHNIPLAIPDANANVSLSGPVLASSRAVDVIQACNRILNYDTFSWINLADRALSCWWLKHGWFNELNYRGDYDDIPAPLRTRIVPANRTIEVWPESQEWHRHHDGSPPQMGPFLTIKLSDGGDAPVFTFHSTSSSPSAFYPVRLTLLVGLVPITLFLAGAIALVRAVFTIAFGILAVLAGALGIIGMIAGQVVTTIFGCLFLVLIVSWFRAGRPPVPFREIKDAVVEAMQNARQGQIALPPDHEPDLEAQAEGFASEMGVTRDVSPPKSDGTTAAEGSASHHDGREGSQ